MNTHDIELPSSDEAAAHMLPSDLKKFESGEHVAEAFSIAVGNPDETSQPLFTLDQVRAAIEADRQRREGAITTTKTDGGSAFPHEQGLLNPGMTLRDYFAAKAMQGMLAHSTRYKPRSCDEGMHWHDALAKEAGEIADAMLATRENKS